MGNSNSVENYNTNDYYNKQNDRYNWRLSFIKYKEEILKYKDDNEDEEKMYIVLRPSMKMFLNC